MNKILRTISTATLGLLSMALQAQTTKNVTFQVDMNQYGGTFTTPEVNGTFNGWCGNCNVLSDANNDGIWEVTLPLTADSIEYKFAHDNWTGQENLIPSATAACTKTTSGFTNRFVVLTGDTVLPVVCWESCIACGTPPDTNSVTFRVDMNQYGGTFTTPEVNGDFNGWCGGCNPLTDADGDGIWETTLLLTNDSIEFKYAYDSWAGQESLSDTAHGACTKTTSGFTNRFIEITSDTILPVVCWESCVGCAYNVTFQVDMNQYTNSFTTPEVNGDFNGWCGGCNAMTDANNDGVWEVTLPLTQDSIEFKYAHDSWAGQENFAGGESCTKTSNGFTNRFMMISADTVLPPVCWGSCDTCSASTAPKNVTFKVDMRGYSGTYTTPEVNGDFNGWCGNCNPLTDADNDSIWETTIAITADSIEFKYSHDAWAGQENFAGGEPCTKTVGGFTNRFAILSGDTTFPAVCWESCDVCASTTPNVDVTFQVDLSQYTGSYTEVNLNGTFNNWCGSCAVMTDSDNDSIYELTVSVPADTIDYKFTLDGWTTEEQLVDGSSCTRTVGGFTNRTLVPAGDTTLAAVCWESCDACVSTGFGEDMWQSPIVISPNPAKDVLRISGELKIAGEISFVLYDVQGREIFTRNYTGTQLNDEWNVSGLSDGMYTIRIQTEGSITTEKVIIRK